MQQILIEVLLRVAQCKLLLIDNQEVLNTLFLCAHRLEKMSFSTAWRWMRLLGFWYDA
jgi:hypothetical protein